MDRDTECRLSEKLGDCREAKTVLVPLDVIYFPFLIMCERSRGVSTLNSAILLV